MLGTIDDGLGDGGGDGDEAKGKQWLADRLYEYHDACETMQESRAGRAPQTLTMVTDASVQHPSVGPMAGYEAATEAVTTQDGATSGSELRWRWGAVEGVDAGWRLQTTDAEETRRGDGARRARGRRP